MRYKLLFLLLMTVTLCHAQPVLNWVKTIGGPMYDQGRRVVQDPSGNLYFAGIYWSTIDVDPGPGEHLMSSSGSWDSFS